MRTEYRTTKLTQGPWRRRNPGRKWRPGALERAREQNRQSALKGRLDTLAANCRSAMEHGADYDPSNGVYDELRIAASEAGIRVPTFTVGAPVAAPLPTAIDTLALSEMVRRHTTTNDRGALAGRFEDRVTQDLFARGEAITPATVRASMERIALSDSAGAQACADAVRGEEGEVGDVSDAVNLLVLSDARRRREEARKRGQTLDPFDAMGASAKAHRNAWDARRADVVLR